MSRPATSVRSTIASRQSAKYAHVDSVVDTGSSVRAMSRHQEERGYSPKPNEVYKRIRDKTLASWIENQGLLELENSQKEVVHHEEPEVAARARDAFSSPQSLPAPSQSQERTFLLLDVRLEEEWEKCHITGAASYPSSMLSRATNELTKEMYEFKNKPNKYIVVYDEEEELAPKVATVIFQKGVDNIVMLSGGLRKMLKDYPEMVVGALPPKPGTAKPASSRASSSSSRLSTSKGSNGIQWVVHTNVPPGFSSSRAPPSASSTTSVASMRNVPSSSSSRSAASARTALWK